MENCVYSNISNVDSDYKQNGTKKRTALFRQIFVCSGLWAMYFIPGLFFGVPPVFIAHTRREANSTDAVGSEMASWLCEYISLARNSSIFGYAALPWMVILPLTTQKFGRKIPFYFVTLSAIFSHLLLYCSTTVTEFLISEIIASITIASHTTLTMLIIAEYTSPRYRGVFLTLKSAILYWAIWIANAVGTFSHWRNIGLIGLLCCVFCGTAVFWPESPYWLASKGRYQECSEAHHWLKGSDEESKKELEILIQNHKSCYDKCIKNNKSSHRGISKLLIAMKTAEFYEPLLLSFALFLLYHCSGKMVCNMYILEIVKQITMCESTAYLTMLILDGLTVSGMYLGCFLTKFLNRKTLLLTCASKGILFLYSISLYLYLIKCGILKENRLVLISLLTGFSIFISIGPILLISSIYAEIIPLKYNHVTSCIVGVFDKITLAIFLKFSPSIFKMFGLHGSFFFYAVSSTTLILILCKYLPETKDKTLQEIANNFKKKDFYENDD